LWVHSSPAIPAIFEPLVEKNQQGNLSQGNEYNAERVCGKSVKIWQNPIMTFPIKKRINTELFIDGNMSFIYTRSHTWE